jgi:hypothetical protein
METADMDRLEIVDDRNWEEFVSAPLAVLTLANRDCPACRAWGEELMDFLASDEQWGEARFGKLVLDDGSSEAFREANDWLELVTGVPFTAIFVAGTPITSFFGSGVERLVRRLDRATAERTNGEAHP